MVWLDENSVREIFAKGAQNGYLSQWQVMERFCYPEAAYFAEAAHEKRTKTRCA